MERGIAVPVSSLDISPGRRPFKNSHGRADINRMIEGDGPIFGEAHTAVGRRVTWQIARVHSIRTAEPHEVMHRCGDKSSARGNAHIDVRVRDEGVAVAIDDLAVDRRGVTKVLLDDSESTSWCPESRAAGGNRGGENNVTIP